MRWVAGAAILAAAACTVTPTQTASPTASPSPSGTPASSATAQPVMGWTIAPIPGLSGAFAQPRAITRTATGYLAVGGRECLFASPDAPDPSACFGGVWASNDLREWRDLTLTSGADIGTGITLSGPDGGLVDVAAFDGTMVVIGYRTRPGRDVATAAVWRADAGGPLALVDLPESGPDDELAAVAAGGAGFVIAGVSYEEPAPRAAVWTSPDGAEWSRVADDPVFDIGPYLDTLEKPGSGGPRELTVTPLGLVAVGSSCRAAAGDPAATPCQPAAWTSSDGASWSRGEFGPGRGVAISVAASGDRLVAVAQAQTLVSPHGATWEAHPVPGVESFQRVVGTPSGFFAIDIHLGVPRGLRSADGVDWRLEAGFPVPQGLLTVAGLDVLVDGDRLIVVGSGETSGPDGFVAFAIVGPAR